MDNSKKAIRKSFCITLINFTSKEEIGFKERFSNIDKSFRLLIRSEKKVSDVIYHESVVHAVVLNQEGLKMMKNEDENIIRSATKFGTCRIYLVAQSGSNQSYENSRLDDFIQRTSQNGFVEVATEIISFFMEADRLNRRSTMLAIRDKICLSANRILKLLWPISYITASLLVLNTVAIFSGFRFGQGLPASEYLIPVLSFFGIFFVVHGIITLLRNWLFLIHISRKFNSEFAIGVLGYLLAIAAVTYSILILEHELILIYLFSMLNIGLYHFYIYTRRIRSELTSISGLQTKMTENVQQIDTLYNIGKGTFSHSAFPLFPLGKKSLFISYMHGSKWSSETAALTYKWATDDGFKVFLDRSTIPPGTLWRRYLLQSISESIFFVAIIDGDAAATEWVLAESAYAALLRKNIGKPRILLVVKNLQKIIQDKQNPFRLNYLDLFEMPNEYCYGAGILSADNDDLSAERFLLALREIRPMSLLFSVKNPSKFLYQIQPTSKDSFTSPSQDDILTIDKAWKTSVLLVVLLTSDRLRPESLRLLLDKCYEWIKSGSVEKEVISLYTLNFLYKSNHLPNDKDLLDKALNLLLANESIAVKLAALDFLSSTHNIQNLNTLISVTVINQIAEFRDKLSKQMKASQKEYSSRGVYADTQHEIAGVTHEIALNNVILKVDNISD